MDPLGYEPPKKAGPRVLYSKMCHIQAPTKDPHRFCLPDM